MSSNHKKLAYLAFALYFLSGVVCMLIGSTMSSLVELYSQPLEKIVLFIGAFATGRTLSVYMIGKWARKDPMMVLFLGTCLLMVYLLGVVLIPAYYVSLVCAFLGGIGMSAQDAICPLFLSRVYPERYSSSLSAGQALYGLGGFAISALVGLMLQIKWPFYVASIILGLVGVSMLILIPFTRWENSETEEQEETVKPLYSKNNRLVLVLLGVALFAYCSICNALGSYMSSYIELLSGSREKGSYLLAIYNLVIVIGALAFMGLLRNLSERTVLVLNSLIITVVMAVALLMDSLNGFYVGFPLIGFFLGVLFTIIIAIGTRLEYRNISVASAFIATIGSCGDIFTPFATSHLIPLGGVKSALYYTVIVMVIQTVVSVLVYMMTKEEL